MMMSPESNADKHKDAQRRITKEDWVITFDDTACTAENPLSEEEMKQLGKEFIEENPELFED